MSLKSAASFHFKTDVLGKAVLRFERLRSERKMRRRQVTSPHPTLSLLESVPHLKELISTHYLHGRYADTHKKVAWVTSGAPVEVLKALGYFTLYPENHAAVCGVRRMVTELSEAAEQQGYSRDLCSYARGDIGSVITGKTPVGNLPRPDLLLCCTNICQTVLYWYQVLAHHFKVPLVIIDTPFIYDQVTDHAVAYVARQLEYLVETAERVAGRTLSERTMRKTVMASRDAATLWAEILECAKHRPAPISAFDQFFFMAPVVDMRGEQVAVDFYQRLLNEVKQRVKGDVGSVIDERKRLLWDNLPIWYHVRPLAEMLAARGYAVVASTYTNAWAELAPMVNADDIINSAAKLYLHVILNRSARHKLNTMIQMIDDYHLDGVILHNNRSCKPYSIGQIDQRRHLASECGVPALLLEADHNDVRAFSEQQTTAQIETFMEMVEG
ncbi:MAG: 2-hydroxyacyl-CoA dehydratase family protein [Myxococcota bacterium]|nr:2-hydroxyacyl-CoA dehydratase family protein [Myxococcota bacterium]